VCKTETETERDCVQAKVQQDEYVYYECKREALIVSRSASAIERQFDEQFLASAVDEYARVNVSALIVSRSASAVEREFDEQFLASAVWPCTRVQAICPEWEQQTRRLSRGAEVECVAVGARGRWTKLSRVGTEPSGKHSEIANKRLLYITVEESKSRRTRRAQ